jgi:hypothetical protein
MIWSGGSELSAAETKAGLLEKMSIARLMMIALRTILAPRCTRTRCVND